MKSSTTSEEFYQRLITDSPFIPGDDSELLEGNQIEWLNPKLLKEGQEFAQKYSFSMNIAHSGALLIGFSFKNLTTVLLRTGNFSNVKNSIRRYAETDKHILDWYMSDILAKKDKGFEDIQLVRKMHSMALKNNFKTELKLFENVSNEYEKKQWIEAMKKDLECFDTTKSPFHLLTYNPTIFMSQFDMAMTQFGFIGIPYLFPNVIGIKDTHGMEGFLHLWAVIGRLIGIQDRFNLALHADKELFLNIFKNIGMASLKEIDLTAVVLQENFTDTLIKLLTFTTLKSSIYFGLLGAKIVHPKFKGKNMYKLMNWYDIFCLKALQFIFFLIYHFNFIRIGTNKLLSMINNSNRKHVLRVKKKSKKNIEVTMIHDKRNLYFNQLA